MSEKLLEVNNLTTKFKNDDGIFTAVNGVSFYVRKGESIGIVGESGCGKSVTSMSIMRLLKEPPAIVNGEVVFEGKSLLELPMSEMRKIRGNDIAMIFQEPMTSLNPVFTCGRQISEALMLHQGLSKQAARERSIEMLRMVGIPLPEKRVDEFPHQLSGGMRQRVMIAMALACHPKLLIADEPTTALDVTIQAQIMELIKDLRKELGMALILITHDLGVVADMAERVIVMYAGDIVEEADVRTIFKNPKHPYTKGLLASIPKLEGEKEEELPVIEGVVPSPAEMPSGCRFGPRCTHCMEKCVQQAPPLIDLGNDHRVRCWLLADGEEKGE
ncbi:MAG: ABC transporter ATP-binding protein [Oscillospiraceae bacterium]|nr:ABC transporter ATP-binding protein [Oscillospiraceae bacterium]